MEETKTIAGNNEAEIWQQVNADLANDNLLEYNVVLKQEGRTVVLDIDIDPGGGFESGYEVTRLTSKIQPQNNFRFALHHEGFIDKMGKLLGMEDVVIGYPELDESLIIKTNDAVKTTSIFNDLATRKLFQSLKDFTIAITHHKLDNNDNEEPFLEFEIQRGVTDSSELRSIYHAFFIILTAIDKN